VQLPRHLKGTYLMRLISADKSGMSKQITLH
jgi:hypothetical protein